MAPDLVAGHVVREWLPGSATFVHTLVAHQRRVRPVVFTDTVTRPEQFPVPALVPLPVAAPGLRRRVQRMRAARAGLPAPWHHLLARAAGRAGCDVLHAHFGPIGFRTLEVAAARGLPLVTTFYGFDLAMGRDDAGWRANYERLFGEGAAFVVEGPHMAQSLAGLGCPADKIHVVRIGIDLDLFPFAPRERGEPLVIFQGARLVAKKGVDVSLRAFALARSELPGAELWIVGDGPERERLETLAGELAVADGVRFHGALPFADYRAAAERAQILLQPSRTAPDGDTEGGAPTAIIEMQALGVPVVATRHADIPFVTGRADLPAEDDAAAVAAELVRAATEPEAERAARLRQARELVEAEHDARRQAARVEELYFFLGTA